MKSTSFSPRPCKKCGSLWHTQGYHNKRKPLRQEAVKTRQKRLSTRQAWFEANPGPDYECYLQIAPDCWKQLTRETVQLEHNLSKTRRQDLKYVVKNLYPACGPCNKLKGSLSAEEVMVKFKG